MINIAELNLKKTSTADVLELLLNSGFTAPSKKEKKELQKKITDAVTDGDFNLALNNMAIGLHFDGPNTFDNIRRKGLFRYSRYTGRKCIVKDVATRLLAICKQLGCNTSERETYLISVINYSSVLTSFNDLDSLMIKEMRIFEHKYKRFSLVKSLLSFADFLFLSGYLPDPKAELTELSAWSKEEISAAVSYLIFLYTSRINTGTIDTIKISEVFLKSREFSSMIVAACSVIDFKDFEINIDHFGYSCIPSNDNLLIKAPFEDFEKAIRLGYIRTDIQQMNDQVETVRKLKGVSMDMLIDKLNEKIDFKFFKFMDGDYSRYRIEMPDPVFDMLVKDFFKPDALFDDEIVYLSQIFKEQLLNHKALAAMKISEDLSLFEFIKIRRVFLLFYVLFAKQVYGQEILDPDVLLRSLIFRFPEKDLHTMIEKLVPVAKLDAFLDLICWEPGMEAIFDLQYRPTPQNKSLVYQGFHHFSPF